MSSQTESTPPTGGQSTPPETIKHKGGSNMGLYAGVAIAVLALVVVGVGYEAGWFTKTNTVTQQVCPTGDTGTPPNCVAPGSSYKACVPYSGQTITVAGSTFVAPLQDQWETSYTTNTLNYESVGSGTGISDLQAFTTDVAASDAPLSYSQTKAFNGLETLTMPESAGGPAVIYNLAGDWNKPINFTAPILAQIFQGTITTWGDSALVAINPALSGVTTPIVVVHRSDGSGTSYVFQQFMQWDSAGAWNLNYSTTWLGPSTIPGEISAKGSSGVTTAVKTTTGAIGYVDLEYALSNSVTYGAVENVKGDFILPTIADITSALTDKTSEAGFALPAGNANWSGVNLLNAPGSGDYPITTFTYLIFYAAPETAFPSGSTVMTQAIAESTANYLNWSVSQTGGQSYSASLYYVPLPNFVTVADQATIGMMDWGSSVVPACEPGTGPVGYQY